MEQDHPEAARMAAHPPAPKAQKGDQQ